MAMMNKGQQQQLVLDIPFKNICSWMQERRLLPNDWVTKLKAAQIKSEQLRTDYPLTTHAEEAVRNIHKSVIKPAADSGEFIYKDAKEVFTQLTEKTEEGKLKSFLGRYKSQLVIDWQLLLRIYEKDNLYLAEYGKLVQQLQGFDLPSLKKQLQSMSKQVNESQQKREDLKRSIRDHERKFNDECQKLGIVPTFDSSALERQAIQMVGQLVEKFKQIDELARGDQTIRDLVEYYREFTKDSSSLPMLTYLSKYGDENLALYEFRQKNSTSDIPQNLQNREANKYYLYSKFDKIVYNEDEDQEVKAEGNNGGVIEIDWSQIDTSNFSLEGSSEPSETQNNQWTVVPDEPFQVVKDSQDTQNMKQYHNEETILYNQETRQLLINDLEEVDYFLKQRISELTAKDSTTYAMYADMSAKEIVKKCDTAEFAKRASGVLEKIFACLNHKDTLHLLLLRQKPKVAAQRIVSKLLQFPKLCDKYRDQIVVNEKKERELNKEIGEVRKQIEEGEKRVRELAQVIQNELSQKLKATVKINM